MPDDIPSPQPMPTTSPKSRPVGEALKAMIDQRTALGISKYGSPLMTHNGRDAERDALEESLDMNQYLMQKVMEQEDEIRFLRQMVAQVRAGHRN